MPLISRRVSRGSCGAWTVPGSCARLARGCILLIAVGSAEPARGAGITAFIQQATPDRRPGVGFALGVPLFTEIVSLEAEYSRSSEGATSPSLTLWSGNLVLTSPVELLRLRPYFALGLGLYRQRLGEATATSWATAEALGAFLRLKGPLDGRLEYRVLPLRGEPLQKGQKRFYAGLTLRL